jgi:hypothetical protein
LGDFIFPAQNLTQFCYFSQMGGAKHVPKIVGLFKSFINIQKLLPGYFIVNDINDILKLKL